MTEVPSGTLCDWIEQQQQQQSQSGDARALEREAAEIIAFLSSDSCAAPTWIVRDCRFVSSAGGKYRHAVLDAAPTGDAALVRYAAVAHSVHAATVLRLLGSASTAAARIAIAALLAAKPPRRLEWSAPVAALRAAKGPTALRRCAQRLCDAALAALAAGALGAVAQLCEAADRCVAGATPSAAAAVAAAGGGNGAAGKEEEEEKECPRSAEDAALDAEIEEAVAVLAAFAQWALAAAPALGTIAAHVGPAREGRKEAAVRGRVAHAIETSRSVQIEPMPIGRSG